MTIKFLDIFLDINPKLKNNLNYINLNNDLKSLILSFYSNELSFEKEKHFLTIDYILNFEYEKIKKDLYNSNNEKEEDDEDDEDDEDEEECNDENNYDSFKIINQIEYCNFRKLSLDEKKKLAIFIKINDKSSEEIENINKLLTSIIVLNTKSMRENFMSYSIKKGLISDYSPVIDDFTNIDEFSRFLIKLFKIDLEYISNFYEKYEDNLRKKKIASYAANYNILRIMSGMGSMYHD